MGTGRKQGAYLQLYELLLGMKKFEGKKWEQQRGLPANRNLLPSTATRLMDLLLRSLRTMRSAENVRHRIQGLLAEFEILEGKQLGSIGVDRLEKGIRLARASECHHELLQLLTRRLRHAMRKQPGNADLLQALRSQIDACRNRLNQLLRLETLHAEVRTLAQRKLRLRPGEASPYDAILADRSIQAPSDSLLVRSYACDIRGIACFAAGDFETAFHEYHGILPDWLQRRDLIPQSGDLYLSLLNNYLTSCLFSERHFAEFEAALTALKQLDDLSGATLFRQNLIAYAQGQLYMMHYGEHAQGKAFMADFIAWHDAHAEQVSTVRKLSFYYNFVAFCFVYGDYRTGYTWLLKMLQLPGRQERTDLRDFARIFQLIFQYEFGNVDLNAYLRRSAYRYFARSEKLFVFESAILEFMRQCLKVADVAELRPHFEKLQGELMRLRKLEGIDPHGTRELLLWIESKLSGVPIGQLYQKEVMENRRQGK